MDQNNNTYNQEDLMANAKHLVQFCAGTKPEEHLLIILDDTTRSIEPYFRKAAEEASKNFVIMHMPALGMHGVEPPEDIVNEMNVADVIIAATQSSLAHTDARFRATERGARYLSLPQYGEDQLSRDSIRVDYLAWADTALALKKILDAGSKITVTTDLGTNLELSAEGREANWAPGFCHEPGMLGSPPDIETNVAPLETVSHGTLVVDGSMPHQSIGLLSEPIRLELEDGAIVKIEETETGRALEDLLQEVGSKRRILAEFGIGLNPMAKLCGLMLEDEGCKGTVHFGFGSNATIGGTNKTDFHLDMVIRNPNVSVDGVEIIKNGELTLPA